MKANKVKAKMRAREKAFGCSFTFFAPQIVEILGALGFDYVFIDGEHGSFSLSQVEEMCRAADLAGLTPLARVPNIEESTILRFLDRGVMGITGPHIRTKADAVALVNACRFVPEGERSFGSARGNEYGLIQDRRAHMARFNEEVLVTALIEDVQALKNLPEILSVRGIDIVSCGPADLAQSLGHPGQADHPDVVQAMAKVAAQTRATDKTFSSDALAALPVSELITRGGRSFLQDTGRK